MALGEVQQYAAQKLKPMKIHGKWCVRVPHPITSDAPRSGLTPSVPPPGPGAGEARGHMR